MRSSLGSIQKRPDGSWRVEVEAGRNPITGKRIRKSKVVRGTRKQAEKVKQELFLELGDKDALRGGITLDFFFQHFYLPDARERLRYSTVDDYESKYRLYIQSAIGGLQLLDLTPLAVDSWLRSISGDSRQHKAFQLLHQVLARAVRLNVMQSNPCDNIERPKRPAEYEPEVLSLDEVPAYLDAFKDTPIEAAFLLCLGCGLRRSELIALDWEDIVDGEVTITHAMTSTGGTVKDDAPKSRFGVRTVSIPPSFLQRLEELRGNGAVAKSSTGTRMHPDNLTAAYKKVLRTLPDGVKRIPLKNLRHTSLSLAANAGVDILAISRRAGHSNVGITSRYYLRPDKAVDRATADAMDKLLGGQQKAP